jgi:hypothetical protein
MMTTTPPPLTEHQEETRFRRFRADPVFTVFLIVVMVVNLALGAAVILLAVNYSSLPAKTQAVAAAEHANQIKNCNASNANRIKDIAVWVKVESIFGGPKANPIAQADFARIVAAVRVKDELQDCAAVYSTAPKT